MKEILEKIPESKNLISSALFEAANIVLYTKNRDFYLDNKGIIRELVQESSAGGVLVNKRK